MIRTACLLGLLSAGLMPANAEAQTVRSPDAKAEEALSALLDQCAASGPPASCFHIGGAVRAETIVRAGGVANLGRASTRTRTTATVDLDARIPTELGEVRAYASVRNAR